MNTAKSERNPKEEIRHDPNPVIAALSSSGKTGKNLFGAKVRRRLSPRNVIYTPELFQNE